MKDEIRLRMLDTLIDVFNGSDDPQMMAAYGVLCGLRGAITIGDTPALLDVVGDFSKAAVSRIDAAWVTRQVN